jgi:hypothetical protein
VSPPPTRSFLGAHELDQEPLGAGQHQVHAEQPAGAVLVARSRHSTMNNAVISTAS